MISENQDPIDNVKNDQIHALSLNSSNALHD